MSLLVHMSLTPYTLFLTKTVYWCNIIDGDAILKLLRQTATLY